MKKLTKIALMVTKTSFWVAIGLDVLGATAIGLGIYNNSVANDYHSKNKKLIKDIPNNPKPNQTEYLTMKAEYKKQDDKAKSAETARNIFYATGGTLLLGGVAVHIWF